MSYAYFKGTGELIEVTLNYLTIYTYDNATN